MPSFTRVCEVVAEAWNEQRDDVEEQATKLTEAIDEHVLRPRRAGGLDAATLDDRGAQRRARSSIAQWGGFGRAPEVPAGDDDRLPVPRARRTPARPRPAR